MATDRVRALLDDLGTVKGQALERLRTNAAAPAAALNPLGLRFVSGARVLDLVSGQRGEVTYGERHARTGEELYSVALGDARNVFRRREELEPDPTTAPASGQ